MPSYPEIAASLTESLRLTQPPVAVCLTDTLPAGVQCWSGHSPAGCRFWQEAANRVFATVSADHGLCSIGQYTHNLEMTPASGEELGAALKVFGELGYVRPADVPQIPVLQSKPGYVIYGPLAGIPVPPDVVLLFVRANQTLILSEASQQLENGLPPAMGRPACAVIPQAKNTGRTALSLGCCGARAYLDILPDDVALYAIPATLLESFSERVAALSKANAVLTQFHQLRRRDVEAGQNPTVAESLLAMQQA
ncbi:MAG: DUF169 domain-containing protein [Acidobacteriota bacterium]|nr:DUF169 domain-containing protein [Acidobacteriota bacterium]